jgi:hypothetical protein
MITNHRFVSLVQRDILLLCELAAAARLEISLYLLVGILWVTHFTTALYSLKVLKETFLVVEVGAGAGRGVLGRFSRRSRRGFGRLFATPKSSFHEAEPCASNIRSYLMFDSSLLRLRAFGLLSKLPIVAANGFTRLSRDGNVVSEAYQFRPSTVRHGFPGQR